MNGKWYVLRTAPGREREAAGLLERKIDRGLWHHCRILYKQQLFRIHGSYVLGRKALFTGYLFVNTDQPEALTEALERSGKFPQMVGGAAKEQFTPVEPEDMVFLRNVCGPDLGHDMALSTVEVDGEGRVRSAKGALSPYRHQIKRQRLNKRFVIASVPLFNRQEEVLFGIRLAGDEITLTPNNN